MACQGVWRYNPLPKASLLMMTQIHSAAVLEPIPGSNRHADFVAGSESRHLKWDEIEPLYQAIARESRYFQFAGIADRIIRCLEQCGLQCDQKTVTECLQAYYLFIGVADDELEQSQVELGEKILDRLAHPVPSFELDTTTSRAQFMTEILKRHISLTNHSQVLLKFRRLHRISVKERNVRTMSAHIQQRKLVGRLTAELSFLLIRDHLSGDSSQAGELMKDIGAVGCLVDSVIDAGADKRAGLMSFRPTFFDTVSLVTQTLVLGMKVVLKHPRLLSLFGEAMRDNFHDRRRSIASY
jgi:hypothetical protein